jgi:regulator of sigma E protease
VSTVLSVIAALLVLSLLIMIHEFGHYLAGRKLGFTILEFAIGMGPVIFKKKKNGIQYSVRALPIGGMCRFLGEDENMPHDAHSFNMQKVWKRIVVITAGPVMNLLFAFVAAIVTITAFGDLVPSVYQVNDDSPAYTAGVETGDVITEIDGMKVMYLSQVAQQIQAADPEGFSMTVERGGEPVLLQVSDAYDAEAGKNVIGIGIATVRMKFSFGETIGRSGAYITNTFKETFSFFGKLAQGEIESTDVLGPAGIMKYISMAVRSSGEDVMRLVVLISASLGIMNLLPIPALDGGRLVFMVIEAIRGKAVPPEKEGMVHFVGLILLFGLMIFLTVNDITNFF